MRIALYGGSFDPIHHGHLILAREAREAFKFDQVVFLLAAISPHKLGQLPTPADLRWEMLQTAVENEPGFTADDLELRRAAPSFAIDSVFSYREKFPGAELFYLIGEDNLAALHTWHRINEFLKVITLIVLSRGENPPRHPHPTISRRCDVSATEIRNRVAKGLSIRYLVPDRVADCICAHQLYLESSHQLIP